MFIMVNDLNDFYCRYDDSNDVWITEVVNDYLTSMCADSNLVRIIVSENQVFKCFAGVKTNKATGPDGITNKVIRTCSRQTAPVLTTIFQRTLDEGAVPDTWKMSVISPIPKTKSVTCLNDYQPISLTSNIMKCLERVVLKFLLAEEGVIIDKD